MNRLLTAKTYVIGAHRIIEEHGLGHSKLVVQSIQNAKHILRSSDIPEWHQTDAMCWELTCALDYVRDRNAEEAMKSLKFVEGLLELASSDTKTAVDRLIQSVFPWRRI